MCLKRAGNEHLDAGPQNEAGLWGHRDGGFVRPEAEINAQERYVQKRDWRRGQNLASWKAEQAEFLQRWQVWRQGNACLLLRARFRAGKEDEGPLSPQPPAPRSCDRC